MNTRLGGKPLERTALLSTDFRFTVVLLAVIIATVFIAARSYSVADEVGKELPQANWMALQGHIDIRSSSATVGTDVPIRITLRNSGPVPMKLHLGSPWSNYSTVLWITNADGSVFKQNANSSLADSLGTERFILKPGESFVLSWNRNAWSGLSNWGYRIDKPGSYTIHVRPHALGFNFSSSLPDSSIAEAKTTIVMKNPNTKQ